MTKYIIFVDVTYYPYVDEVFDDLPSARKRYDKLQEHYSLGEKIYLCKIIDEVVE